MRFSTIIAKTLIIVTIISLILYPFHANLIQESRTEKFQLHANSFSRQKLSCLMLKGGIEELPVINASNYDGENDTERLQAALDDVPSEGAIVYIPSGVWIAAGLRVKSNTIILGENGTIIVKPENFTIPFIIFENISNFALLNITFEGENIPDGLGVLILNCQNFLIQNNVFLNIQKNALKVTVTITTFSQNFVIANNSFINCQNAPLLIFGNPSRRAILNFEIKNNIIINGTKNGKIGMAFCASGEIENNKVINCQHGIATRCVSNITITRNHIENIADYGIYLGTQIGDQGTDRVKIEKNEIYCGRIGIARYYGDYPISDIDVIDNIFLNNSQYDILADFPANFMNNTITDATKLKIIEPSSNFIGTRSISGYPILPGDLNLDYKIDIIDITLVVKFFGSMEGSPNWYEKADIISDGKIDIVDISYVVQYFGVIA